MKRCKAHREAKTSTAEEVAEYGIGNQVFVSIVESYERQDYAFPSPRRRASSFQRPSEGEGKSNIGKRGKATIRGGGEGRSLILKSSP